MRRPSSGGTTATATGSRCSGSAAQVLDEQGVPVEIVHSFRDISSIRAADESKTLFLATASHELKTP